LPRRGTTRARIALLDSVAGQVAAAKAKILAQERAGRDAARSELEAIFKQIEAIVATIDDKALNALVAGDAAKARAAFAATDKLADAKAAQKAFVAAKPGAEHLLEKARAVKAVAEWVKGSVTPLVSAAEANIEKVSAAGAKAALKKACAALKAEIDKRAAAIDLGAAQATEFPKLQALAQLAADLVEGSARRDDELAQLRKAIEGLGAEATPEVKEALAKLANEKRTSWPAGTTVEQVRASTTAFDAKLKALDEALKPLKAAFDARLEYEQALASFKGELDPAIDLRANQADALTSAEVKAFDAAKKVVDDAVAAKQWVRANAGIASLKAAAHAITKTVQERDAYYVQHNLIFADYLKAWKTVVGPGVPDDIANAFWAAANPLQDAEAAKAWKIATAAITKVKVASAAVLGIVTEGQTYYAVYDAAKTDIDKGRKAFYDNEAIADRLAVTKADFKTSDSNRVDAVAAKDLCESEGCRSAAEGSVDCACRSIRPVQARESTLRYRVGQAPRPRGRTRSRSEGGEESAGCARRCLHREVHDIQRCSQCRHVRRRGRRDSSFAGRDRRAVAGANERRCESTGVRVGAGSAHGPRRGAGAGRRRVAYAGGGGRRMEAR